MKNQHTNQSIGNDKPLEIYSKSRDNYEYENFALGYIVKNLGPYFILQTIDDYGFLDSYTIMAKDDISKVSLGTTYSKLFDRYVEYAKHQNIFDPFHLQAQFKHFNTSSFLKLLNYCLENTITLSVYTATQEYVQQGKILSIDEHSITINEVEYGEINGFSGIEQNEPIQFDDITAVDVLSKENFLFDHLS
ncbi:hypothetical protein MOO44_01635 (plasmid) [Nicoliella spurrieriana]|uniref:Uncharacterized protein n=1 Tax=Nicoliella spurrieriana TaxID=2925830 RepID=A0A976RQR8_9LACO|nr:hypothetical protein [Nicoliella spurrieriana]UQS86049.1 hypothetical protein MOO44_01635 [Nicoliella spurrieriana]